MKSFDFHCFLRPVPKGRPRFGRHGAFTPKKTRDFETLLKNLFRLRAPKEPLKGPVSAEVTFVLSIKDKKLWGLPHTKRPDLDNFLKAIADSMNGVLVEDDSQLFSIAAKKYYGEQDEIFVSIREAVSEKREGISANRAVPANLY